jgi:hypothetical protein
MPNLSAIVKKLQRAILSTGLVIKIGSSQFYSADQGRMITMWSLSTPVMEYGKDKWKMRDLEILRTASQADVVLTLKEIWEQSQGWE